MEQNSVTELRTLANQAVERQAARFAERTRTTSDESASAADKLWEAMPYLRDWYDSMTALRTAPAGEETEAELMRLTRVGGIVGNLVTEARAHTAEAKRINHSAGD